MKGPVEDYTTVKWYVMVLGNSLQETQIMFLHTQVYFLCPIREKCSIMEKPSILESERPGLKI